MAGGREGRLVQDRSPSSDERQVWVRRPVRGSRLQAALSGLRGARGMGAGAPRSNLKEKFITHLLGALGQEVSERTRPKAPSTGRKKLWLGHGAFVASPAMRAV